MQNQYPRQPLHNQQYNMLTKDIAITHKSISPFRSTSPLNSENRKSQEDKVKVLQKNHLKAIEDTIAVGNKERQLRDDKIKLLEKQILEYKIKADESDEAKASQVDRIKLLEKQILEYQIKADESDEAKALKNQLSQLNAQVSQLNVQIQSLNEQKEKLQEEQEIMMGSEDKHYSTNSSEIDNLHLRFDDTAKKEHFGTPQHSSNSISYIYKLTHSNFTFFSSLRKIIHPETFVKYFQSFSAYKQEAYKANEVILHPADDQLDQQEVIGGSNQQEGID
jgi:chromosome segregation ATPase